MIYDKNVDKKEFSIEWMFRPSLVPKYIMNGVGNVVISSSSTSVTVESYYHVLTV